MKKILSIFKFSNKIGNDPFVDWVLILSISFVIAFALVSVGSYVYVNTQTDLITHSTTPATNNKPNFDVQMLNKVINAFDARANERVLLSKGYTGPTDPSLP